MKKPLTLLFLILIFGFAANATTYYVSNSGSDYNSGTSTSAPWKTLAKVSSFTGFRAGDAILFNRGEVFYGMLTINNSGYSGSPITFGAYGSGATPIITGFTTVSSWTNLGSNIWESTNAVSALSTCNMVAINSVNTPMGRYPNTGYLTYQSFSGKTSITSSSLSGTPNWTGAEVVIRKQRWITDRNLITAQSGGTLTYTASSTYNGQSGYGFFIQNDARTLDVQNEWYYNPSTKKIRIYSTTTPTNVRVVSKDTLVYMKYRNYVTFSNISFQGSNKDAFVILSSSNVTIQNCSIDYSGKDAIWGNQNLGQSSSSFVLKNSTINHTNNNAINLASEFAGALISHNTIKNTGMIAGMGGSGDGTYEAVQATGVSNVIVEYNEIDSTGYIGIMFSNNNTIIRNNLLNGFCLIKLDGGGIFTWNWTTTAFTGQKILNNILLNGIGDNAGTNATGFPIAHGIYLDGGSANIEIAGNSMVNCSNDGMYIHNSHNLNIHNNTFFNNGNYQALFVSFDVNSPIRNVLFKNNIIVSKAATQWAGSFQSITNDLGSFGTLDSNYWARPIDDNITIDNSMNNYTLFAKRTLGQWQTFSLQDPHSKKSPKAITSVNDLRFEYNASEANKTIYLGANYIDMKNASYNGSITLAPYTSAVLIYNGASTTNQPPVANAGPDQTITLPTSSTTLTGSGTDANGTISAYNWTKISGPSAGTINSATTAATLVSALVQGIYKFQLKVTDNAGASDVDTVQVIVNATTTTTTTTNLLPAVNLANVANGINYNYYVSSVGWSWMPIFSSLTPAKTGTTTNFNISLATRSTTFAFYFSGFISVPSDGTYTFYTNSDDGSYLAIDGVVVINNDGLHAALEKSGTIGLKAGKHTIAVGYFQQGGGSVLSVSYSGPGITKQVVPASALYIVPATVAMNNNINQAITSPAQVGIKAYPNPFINYIMVNINGAAGEYKLVLINASGQIIWTKNGTKSEGDFQQSINTSTLQKGIYFLRVIQNNNGSVIKLEK
jgi:parallel beta-helix repeat protein